jgi:succinate dehydrogenase / fumarate reductase iron-sulfur subunit
MAEKASQVKDVVFSVRRYTPERDPAPYFQNFTVPVKPGMTVLDGLHYIKENLDQTLVWRYSCRMGVCGSCGMLLNGRPTLACNTQVLDLADQVLAVAPLPNFDVVRDLVPDLVPMFDKHRSLMPYVVRNEAELNDPAGEYEQSPEELEEYLQFSFCIRCGCCMAACPTLATDVRYLGPMPLAQAYRYNVDTRDGARGERSAVAGSGHGAFRCHYAGECSRACPKGVDPAKAIQHLKRQLVLDYLHLARKRTPCGKQHGPGKLPRDPKIPEAPPYTVGK